MPITAMPTMNGRNAGLGATNSSLPWIATPISAAMHTAKPAQTVGKLQRYPGGGGAESISVVVPFSLTRRRYRYPSRTVATSSSPSSRARQSARPPYSSASRAGTAATPAVLEIGVRSTASSPPATFHERPLTTGTVWTEEPANSGPGYPQPEPRRSRPTSGGSRTWSCVVVAEGRHQHDGHRRGDDADRARPRRSRSGCS